MNRTCTPAPRHRHATSPPIARLLPFGLLAIALVGCELVPIGNGGRPSPEPESGPAFLDLPGDSLFPEGILAAQNGDLYVSGFGNGAVVRVTGGTDGELFKEPGEDGLARAVGMGIDEARGRLWVASFDFATFGSTMKVFDVATGALLATLAPEPDGQPHFFNEVALDADGRAYVTDTASPVIWTAGPDLDGIEPLVTDAALANPDPDRPFGLNGLALTPDGRHLIASVMDRITPGGGRLVRVDAATGEIAEVELEGEPETIDVFGGSDGMFFEEGGLLMMVNVTDDGPIAAIVTAEFNGDYTEAELVARGRFDAVYDRPTASAVRNGRLWTVNSQLDHLIDDENGALGTLPERPFRLVHISLKETLGR